MNPSPDQSAAMAPAWADEAVEFHVGDALEILPTLPRVDAVVTDPPYGETSLAWDVRVKGWLDLLPTDSLWCFGSLRSFMAIAPEFDAAGWTLSQDIVWEKHNGSSFHADRFKRVHEVAAHFYRGTWADLHHETPTTPDATKRTLRRNHRPPHTGHIEASAYASEDGGPRLMRSVVYVRSAHGSAVHPTQKPEGILRPLIEYACPPGGIVLDPFAGSGSTGLAARQSGRRAILIEKDEGYADAAIKRLAQMELVA